MKKMNGMKKLILALLLVMMASLLVGCSKTPRTKWYQFWRPSSKYQPKAYEVIPAQETISPDVIETVEPIGDIEFLPLTDVSPPSDEVTIPETPPIRMEPKGVVSELRMVNFEFDKSHLTAEARASLDNNARWIFENPGVQILIEGHCDERGTSEYNMNLGQRRGASVREYLIYKGVDPNTLHTISYGEERPVDPSHNETAWAKNRRAQFFIY